MSEHALRELDQAMARLGDGDRSAFDDVFRTLWPRVLAFCTHVLSIRAGHAEAEDVVQRALLKVFERASQYDPSKPAVAWALAIAGWECRTALQAKRRRKEEPDEILLQQADARTLPEECSVHMDLLSSLQVAMADLSSSDQATLAAAFEQQSDEAASGASFRKRKQRAIERLRQTWRRLCEHE